MYNTLQAPWVGRAPETTAAEYPRCPICGREPETFYFRKECGIEVCVGCDCCLSAKNYDDVGDAISTYEFA